MDKDTLRKVQLTQLEIYKQVFEIAESNQITVYLYAGSLLGAVRHKGFIPWDDDLDLMVPRADYDRLMICLSKELPQQFWLQTYDTDPQYWQGFAKVRKKGTLYKEKDMHAIADEKCGIWIDIFPLDYAKKRDGIGLKFRKHLIQTIGFSLQKKILKRDLSCFSRRYIPAILFWSMFSAKVLQKWQVLCMRKASAKNAEYLVSLAGTDRVQKVAYKAEWFSGSVKLPFEDTVCFVPQGYDRMLAQLYGDYMTPPPEDKQRGHNVDEQFPIIV